MKIIIRPSTKKDEPRIVALHKSQGLDYDLPDMRTIVVGSVIEEEGEITNVVLLRRTCEAYWIFDPKQTRRERLGRLFMFHKELVNSAKRAGLEDIHAWIPPEVASNVAFNNMMIEKLGWVKPLWTCYSREVG
jgi:hypothetical protein